MKQIPFSYKQNVVMLMRITDDSSRFDHVTYLNLLSDEGSSCEGVSVASVTSVVSSTCSVSASIWKILVLFSVRQDTRFQTFTFDPNPDWKCSSANVKCVTIFLWPLALGSTWTPRC